MGENPEYCVRLTRFCPSPVEDPFFWLAILSTAEVVVWLILFCVVEMDLRGSAARVLVRMFVPLVILSAVPSALVEDPEWIFSLGTNAFGLPLILITCAGPGALGAVPGVWPPMVRFFMLQLRCAK